MPPAPWTTLAIFTILATMLSTSPKGTYLFLGCHAFQLFLFKFELVPLFIQNAILVEPISNDSHSVIVICALLHFMIYTFLTLVRLLESDGAITTATLLVGNSYRN
jgi:hypothetical protein